MMFINPQDNIQNYYNELVSPTSVTATNKSQESRKKIKSLDSRVDKQGHVKYRYQRCINEQLLDRNGHAIQFNNKSISNLSQVKNSPRSVKNFVFETQSNFHLKEPLMNKNLNLPGVYFRKPKPVKLYPLPANISQNANNNSNQFLNSSKRGSEPQSTLQENSNNLNNSNNQARSISKSENQKFNKTYCSQQPLRQGGPPQKESLESILEKQKFKLQQKKEKMVQLNDTLYHNSQFVSQDQSYSQHNTTLNNSKFLHKLDPIHQSFQNQAKLLEKDDKYTQQSIMKNQQGSYMPKLTGNAYKIKEQNLFLIEEGQTNLNQLIKKNKQNKNKKQAFKQVSKSTKNLQNYFHEINGIKKQMAERSQKHRNLQN